ncbi:hypothetical protein GO986_09010 [Deinococcus sp. HMF7620]|uniref:Uncharacterized protein n=1 Tax=Deinococcus arboris TaxID=2682977 RepID=A0A7C9M8F8_9DEIO|nr:hypothetical protein [Deinococcus arboris]MVN86903.1 hypothetical protein [Deinococcus arboris]
MTGSSDPPALTTQQLAAVRTYATAAALNYHNATVPVDDQVDLPASFELHGSLKLVAADVLEAACLQASKAATGSSGGVKRVKVEGEVEIERFAATPVDSVTAQTWCDRAARLRKEVSAASGGGIRVIPSPVAGMRVGGNPEPVFRVTRPCREDSP